MKYGIDISEFQGNYTIPKDLDFIIIRAGDGIEEDTYFRTNYGKAKALGLPRGIYWRLNPHYSAEEQYLVFAELLQTFPPTMGAWIDIESEDIIRDPDGMAGRAYIMADLVENLGYYTGLYYSAGCTQYLQGMLSRFDSWVAAWDNDPADRPKYGTLKQYSNSAGVLDLDVSYVDDLSIYNITPEAAAPVDELAEAIDNVIKLLEGIKNEFC